MLFRKTLLFILLLLCSKAYSQQDVQFHLYAHLLPGKKILKVKRDFHDPYVWVLAQNNEVYRVNSLTQAIDDYTATFSAYANFSFIDIAGRSQDTVFIATNSTQFIQYKNGASKLIGSAYGISGTITSIGIDYTHSSQKAIIYNYRPGVLIVGTTNGLYRYNIDTETAIHGSDDVNSTVFEATYRKEMYSGFLPFSFLNSGSYLPVNTFANLTGVFGGYLWLGGKFGNNINTATEIPTSLYSDDYATVSNYFWGNENGMFQNSFEDDNNSGEPNGYEQYLNNININKITDIYGLTTFGDANSVLGRGLIKDNLLVGTDQGLYFSTSIYNSVSLGYFLRPLTLFHYDEIGNVRINDICVNPESTSIPICENGVWLAADDGLYFIKPDWGAYLDSRQFQAVNFINLPDTVSKTSVCSGDSVSAWVNTFFYSGKSIQWFKNGGELLGANKDTLNIKAAGDYYAVLYNPCGDEHIESNHLTVTEISSPVFTFNYPDTIQRCNENPGALQVTYNPAYHYQWYTNDVLNGDTSAVFAVTQSGKYKVEVSACPNSWVPSQEVQVNLIQLPVPVIKPDKQAYCIGDVAILSIAVPSDPSYTINWYRNNVLLTEGNNRGTLTTSTGGSYTVSVVNNTVNTDGTTCSQVSAAQTISFNALPAVSIEKIIKTTLCDGQIIDLLAHYTGGSIQWSTGESADQISVTAEGNYKATVTSAAGCQADASIGVTLLPNPVFNVNDTSICTYKHQTLTLTAPPGFSQYAWNGVSGGQTYRVNQPQIVNLTIIDANGCQASQQIKIAEQCPSIFIPNTFTPNGDGINDTWVIEGLDNDPTVFVRIFTRYGTQVYESKGYGAPWNGEYNGKKLPAGVYYYIVNAKNGTQKFSGSLTIIY